MAVGNSNGSSNRNLWIILGTCIGVIVLASLACIYWTYRKRSKRQSIFSVRAITPLDDAEIESWRRPSEWTQRSKRYTVLPAKPLPVARIDTRRSSSEKDWFIERPRTPPETTNPNFSRPISAHKTPYTNRRRNSSIYSEDRPPTPYSPTKGEKDDTVSDISGPASPRTRSIRSHRQYPSVSEVSEFDFDFEKSDANLNLEYHRSRNSQQERH